MKEEPENVPVAGAGARGAKTAITLLQEIMMKQGENPEYEYAGRFSGPLHQALFEYVCRARGLAASGAGHSLKEAKQKAARALLARLAAGGQAAPAPRQARPLHHLRQRLLLQANLKLAGAGAGGAKTPFTLLQEMIMNQGEKLKYEYAGRFSGPHHQALFEYVCRARGLAASGAGHSLKEAKQKAARALLARLVAGGQAAPAPRQARPLHHLNLKLAGAGAGSAKEAKQEAGEQAAPAPPPAAPASPPAAPAAPAPPPAAPASPPAAPAPPPATPASPPAAPAAPASPPAAPAPPPAAPAPRSHVALLKELCKEHCLPAAKYKLVGDSGPPHLRRFTVRAALGRRTRLATASTKKAASQLAAEALYAYLRHKLRRTTDFVEEEALTRAHERAMEEEDVVQRPHLAQRIADYHLGLHDLDTETLELGAAALEGVGAEDKRGSEQRLHYAAAALRLTPAWAELARVGADPLEVVTLAPSTPLAFVGETRAAAAARAVWYLQRALPPRAAAARLRRALSLPSADKSM